jgi:hypothetical protein
MPWTWIPIFPPSKRKKQTTTPVDLVFQRYGAAFTKKMAHGIDDEKEQKSSMQRYLYKMTFFFTQKSLRFLFLNQIQHESRQKLVLLTW